MILRLLTLLTVVTAGAVGGVMVATDAGPVAAASDVVDGVASYTQTDSTASEDAVDGSTTPEGIDGSGGEATTTPFAFSVDRVESCGTTCRDVTSTLTNQQSTAATDVTVETDIYAGNSTVGDPVWTGTESVGTLDVDESDTTTKRVDLSLSDAYAIERNDGWVTVETTVRSDGETVTTTERRNVN